MQKSHLQTIKRYDEPRKQARLLAKKMLPQHLQGKLKLEPVDTKAVSAFKILNAKKERVVDWDWSFASRYTKIYPKAFDLSVWHGNTLCSLSLGRPTFNGTAMRLDFVEKFNKHHPFSKEMFPITLLAYEAYGRVIGAEALRIMNPLNKKLIEYYSSHGGFTYEKQKQGNPHYLVKKL